MAKLQNRHNRAAGIALAAKALPKPIADYTATSIAHANIGERNPAHQGLVVLGKNQKGKPAIGPHMHLIGAQPSSKSGPGRLFIAPVWLPLGEMGPALFAKAMPCIEITGSGGAQDERVGNKLKILPIYVVAVCRGRRERGVNKAHEFRAGTLN